MTRNRQISTSLEPTQSGEPARVRGSVGKTEEEVLPWVVHQNLGSETASATGSDIANTLMVHISTLQPWKQTESSAKTHY